MSDRDEVVTYRSFDPSTFRWDGVTLDEYKRHEGEQPGEGWKNITRQVAAGRFGEPCSFRLRYFEVGPGGHSSLEKHEHVHVVLAMRGIGRVIVGDEVHETKPFDLIYVPPMVPHQFINTGEEPYGFLCIVDHDRDRPQALSPEEVEHLLTVPEAAAIVQL